MSVIDKILAYQEEDRKLFEIEKDLSGSESRKKGVEAQRFLRSVSETLAGLEAKSQELCLAYENALSALDRLKDDNAEFNEIADKASDEKELAYLKGKASELVKSLNELSFKVQKIKQEMNELAVNYGKLKKETVSYQAIFKKAGEEYSALKEQAAPKRKEIEKNLEKLEKGIPEELMKKYKEKRKDKHFPIVYKIEGTYCSACGTSLSQKILDKLEKDGSLIECENCRKLIFKAD